MKSIPGTKYITSAVMNGRRYFPVYKCVDGRSRFFGQGRTLIEALMIRDWCIANNWEKRYSKHSTGEKYICIVNGDYRVAKHIDGVCENFGSFKNLEEAIKERDLCIACNWDWDEICECIDEEWVL